MAKTPSTIQAEFIETFRNSYPSNASVCPCTICPNPFVEQENQPASFCELFYHLMDHGAALFSTPEQKFEVYYERLSLYPSLLDGYHRWIPAVFAVVIRSVKLDLMLVVHEVAGEVRMWLSFLSDVAKVGTKQCRTDIILKAQKGFTEHCFHWTGIAFPMEQDLAEIAEKGQVFRINTTELMTNYVLTPFAIVWNMEVVISDMYSTSTLDFGMGQSVEETFSVATMERLDADYNKYYKRISPAISPAAPAPAV